VAEVWIVNLSEATVEVYREPHFTGYGNKTIVRAGETIALLAFPDATVDVAELLKKLSPVTSKPATKGRIKTSHSEVLNSYQVS
jgi:hypothetical protein